ncbi:MAG: hypothetical protein R3E42_07240 [Burkholderiaceae bacterium]
MAALPHHACGALKLLRIDTNAVQHVTEEEINASLEEGVDAGLIEEHEHQMVRNVFLLDDRQLTSIMVPHSEIEWLDAQETVDSAVQKAWAKGHSWYPVCRDGLDDVVGVIHLPFLLSLQSQGLHTDDSVSTRCRRCLFPKRSPAWSCWSSSASGPPASFLWWTNMGVVQGVVTRWTCCRPSRGAVARATGGCLGDPQGERVMAGRWRYAGGRTQVALCHRRPAR